MTSDHLNRAMIPAGSTQFVAAPVNDPVETAVTLWAEASTRPETRERDGRLRDKQQIVLAFLRFTGKHPGEVGPADVREWRRHLEEQGRAENTIYSYISRVSSFYEWLRKHADLREQIRTNPAELVRPKAPRPYQTEKTKAWTDGQMNALLGAIAEEAARGSIHALRDYAVTLFYLFSGLRRNELFGLRGNDLELEETGLIVRYQRKGGKYQRREVGHPDVREALLAYLKAAKRLSVLQTVGPLWTRHDRAGEPGPPLNSRSFANNLKRYAAKAGIERVNIHQTRHTYARIVFEDTGDLLETQSALDHESQATTRVYVQTVAVKRDRHSDRIARRIMRNQSWR